MKAEGLEQGRGPFGCRDQGRPSEQGTLGRHLNCQVGGPNREELEDPLSPFINLFIYFWLRWVFVAACRLSLVEASGGYSSLRCMGFSLRWLLLLWSTGFRRAGFSSCGSWALENRLSSCGAWAYLLCGMWDLPRPGLEPMSPALASGVLTTAPPGKPPAVSLCTQLCSSTKCLSQEVKWHSC